MRSNWSASRGTSTRRLSRPENTNALLALRFKALLGEGGAYVLEVAGALIQ